MGQIYNPEYPTIFEIDINSDSEALQYTDITTASTIRARNITNVDWLSNLEDFTYLDLSNNNLTDSDLMVGVQFNDNVFTLLPSFRSHSSPSYLNLSNNKLTNVDALRDILNIFQDIGNYHYINLSGNQITNLDGFEHPFCGSLSFIDLSYNGITSLDILPEPSIISYMNFSYNEITSIDILLGTRVVGLDFSNNKITSINGLSGAIYISDLDLSNNNLTNINGLSNTTDIDNLNLSNNQLTNITGINRDLDIDGINFNNAFESDMNYTYFDYIPEFFSDSDPLSMALKEAYPDEWELYLADYDARHPSREDRGLDCTQEAVASIVADIYNAAEAKFN